MTDSYLLDKIFHSEYKEKIINLYKNDIFLYEKMQEEFYGAYEKRK